MAADPKPKAAESKDPKTAGGAASPHAKIDEMRAQIQQLQTEIKILEGMLKNRRPEFTEAAKKETESLRARSDRLVLVLQGMMCETLLPRDKEEWAQQLEILKTSCVDACKRANIEEAIWKEIESLS